MDDKPTLTGSGASRPVAARLPTAPARLPQKPPEGAMSPLAPPPASPLAPSQVPTGKHQSVWRQYAETVDAGVPGPAVPAAPAPHPHQLLPTGDLGAPVRAGEKVQRTRLVERMTLARTTLHDYYYGPHRPDAVVRQLLVAATHFFPQEDDRSAVNHFSAMVGQELDVQRYIYALPDKRHIPTEAELTRIIQKMGFEPRKMRALISTRALVELELREGIIALTKDEPRFETLERFFRLLHPEMSTGGRSVRDVLDGYAVSEYAQGKMNGHAAQYSSRINGSMPLQKMLSLLMDGIGKTAGYANDLIDTVAVILNASWGRDTIEVHRDAKRSDYQQAPSLKHVGVVRRLIERLRRIRVSVKGADLANEVGMAERAGQRVRTANLYTLLAEQHLFSQEAENGYYDYVLQYYEAKNLHKVQLELKAEKSTRALRRKLANRGVDSAIEKDMREKEPWLASDTMSNSFDSSVSGTFGPTSTLLPYVKKGTVWVHPYREFRRILYGMIAAQKWAEVATVLLEDGDVQNASLRVQQADAIINNAMYRVEILMLYTEDEVGAPIAKSMGVIAPSFTAVKKRVRDLVAGIQTSRSGNGTTGQGPDGASGSASGGLDAEDTPTSDITPRGVKPMTPGSIAHMGTVASWVQGAFTVFSPAPPMVSPFGLMPVRV